MVLLQFPALLLAQDFERGPVDDSERTVNVDIEPEVFVPTREYVESSDETSIDHSELSLTPGSLIESVVDEARERINRRDTSKYRPVKEQPSKPSPLRLYTNSSVSGT